MALPSVTYTFVSGTPSDANQVNTNFLDIINSLTDGTKSLTVSSVGLSGIAASRALVSDASKILSSSNTTSTEIGYLSGMFSQPVCRVATTKFTASGTWTKATLNPKFVRVTVVGAGGGGGGTAATGVGQCANAACGGGGGTSIKTILSASLGATETVTVGTGGAGGSAGNNAGSNGGTSSFGTWASATGGSAGNGMAAVAVSTISSGGSGGVGSLGDINFQGGDGSSGRCIATDPLEIGISGSSYLCGGVRVPIGTSGSTPTGYGGGGSGAAVGANIPARAGGAGSDGIVIVEEFY